MNEKHTLQMPSELTTAAITQLALELHKSRSNDLRIPTPEGIELNVPNEFLSFGEDGQIRFRSLEIVNTLVANHTLAQLRVLGSLTGKSLFDAAHELWRCEIGRSDMAAGRLLATVEDIDVLDMAATRIADGARVFDILHALQAYLLHTKDICLDSLVALNDVQYEKTRGDLAVGMLFASIENWLTERTEIAKKFTHQLLLAHKQTRENLLGAVWMGWFKGDATSAAQALLVVVDSNKHPHAVPLAIRIAGRMLDTGTIHAECEQELNVLINDRIWSTHDAERLAAIQAAARLIHQTNHFDARLGKLADAEDQVVLTHVAMALGTHQDAMLKQENYFNWLNRCTALIAEQDGAIEALDYPLSLLVVPEGVHINQVMSFMKIWVEKQPNSGPHNRQFSKSFSQCVKQIFNHPTILSTWLTEWLLSESAKLPSSVAGVLMAAAGHGASNLKLDPKILDELNFEGLMFLSKRLLGYIHDVDQLLSLSLSLLGTANAENRVFPFMESLLIEQIGYDYPDRTVEILKKSAQDTSDNLICDLLSRICSVIEKNIAQLEHLPRLKEFAPSNDLRKQFILARSRQMRIANKEAQKDSIMAHISTTTYVKAGSTTFQYLRDSYTEPMRMTTHSYSLQIPRREIHDPVGNAIKGIQMRNAKKDEP